VSANPSSRMPIPPGLTALCDASPLRPAEPPDLLAYLSAIPGPRACSGRRHPLIAILALAAAAVLAGARSFAAIAEWAADAPQPVRAGLGARRDPLTGCFMVPTETTIRRTLGRLDAQALGVAIGAWLCARDRHHDDRLEMQRRQRRRAVAVDGKRCVAPAQQRQTATAMATRAVLAQQRVGGAPEEVSAFAPLLVSVDLAGVVVTADALQTHPEATEFLVTRKQAHYLFTVKANQSSLLQRCAGLPWHGVPVLDRTSDRGHGRLEVRTLKAVTVGHFGFPTPPRSCRSPASARPTAGADALPSGGGP
jgi:DDE_Tnp_1-associated